jgi:Protein of unknown function (DUF1553)/Protein of unknown function (DUF1549)/Concanavalin A-like lectin/glucanases superfamily/Planctomycete cytochrome C
MRTDVDDRKALLVQSYRVADVDVKLDYVDQVEKRGAARSACAALLGGLAAAVVALLLVAGCARSADPDLGGLRADEIDYNWHVRPILSENCFKCHGPDPAARKAKLRLDIGDIATAELPETAGKFAIVPRHSERSELVRRITSRDPDARMPPESTHKTLSAQQVAILRQWIDNGAEYRPHWAFIPPKKPAVPQTAFASGVANDVDRFVFAKLERNGLSPAREADKETLVNRVTLTLTGLPPQIADVDAFLKDAAPDAYERLVDRLLASPAYAEHMAEYWLDLARWSETDGFLDDHHDRFLWPWRDWVIAAFKNDMPFDRFGTEQLAGDLLPAATKDQVLATAFLRVGKRTTENGAIDAEYKAEYMVDRTDNALGIAFLGLTVGCARCHDHKYDPIKQRDYYSLGAFFNSNDEPGAYAPGFSGIQGGPTLAWPDQDAQAKVDAAERELAAREAAYDRALAAARPGADDAARKLAASDGAAAALRASLAKSEAAYYPFDSARPAALTDLPEPRAAHIPPPTLTVFRRNAYGGAPPAPKNETPEQRKQREQFQLAQRVPRNYNAESLTLSASATPGVEPAVIQGPVLRDGVRGNALWFDETNRGFLGRDVGYYDRTDPFSIDFWFYVGDDYENVPVLNNLAEQNSGRTGYRFTIDHGKLWISLAHSPPANMIAIETQDALPVRAWTHVAFTYDGSSRAGGMRLYLNGAAAAVDVKRDHLTRSILPFTSGDVFDPYLGVEIGTRFREKAPVGSAIDELRFYSRDLAPAEVQFLHDDQSAAAATADQLAPLLLAAEPNVAAARAALTKARVRENELATAVPQVLVMGDAPEPIPTFVLNRGVYSALGEQVAPHGLDAVLPWDAALPPNRAGLAQWLFDPRNPLTARVFVNRIWQMHFGRGIVETAEDFGSQGSIPTHPELLDWLAVRFVESGWDVKALHRLIVTSATYKQRSELSDESLARDARNELYARGPRWRMTAEMVRDSALAASGLLATKVGGPSVEPYQPSGIWNPLNSFYEYPAPADLPEDDLHRRTIYTFVKRNAPHPELKIFDFKNRTESIARRRSSNTPLQALVLENDPQFVEAYRALAQEVLRSSSDETEQLTRLYRLAARETPAQAHLELMSRYYRAQREVFVRDERKAEGLLGVGVSKPDPALDRASLAAMTNVAALVMNSPDAYTVR